MDFDQKSVKETTVYSLSLLFHYPISLRYTYVVQSCLADRIILDAQHLHHLLHFAKDLSQRDVL